MRASPSCTAKGARARGISRTRRCERRVDGEHRGESERLGDAALVTGAEEHRARRRLERQLREEAAAWLDEPAVGAECPERIQRLKRACERGGRRR